jgi:urea transport system substrate-binding protein
MGAVYEGEDAALKRKVAVKFLPEELLKQPDVIERFMREAQVAGGLNHPNIIAVYDVGKDERGCYMVIELLNPKSASSRIKTEGPYHWIVATRIIADCAAALSIAHENGIIHRDIKPDNILFSHAGGVKLVDFGLVKLVEDDLNLTQSGMLCGSPLYMSPEQASNHPMDTRTDLYSLGATYYALLAGRPPFNGTGLPQILLSHLTAPTPDPREIVPEVPEECVKIVMRAMEKKPAERYQTAAAMVADLEAILSGIPQRNQSVFAMQDSAASIAAQSGIIIGRSASFIGQKVDVATAGAPSPAAADAARSPESPPKAGSRRAFLAASGLAVLGLGGFFLLRRGPRPGSGDAPAGGLAADAGTPGAGVGAGRPPIKVGILHSLSGSLAVSEHPLADSSLLALEELNARGGLLGRQLLPIVVDGKSEISADSAFTRGAEKLLKAEKVAVVFGGFGSAGRKAIRPFFEQYDQLLFYPAQYEGIEESQNIVYTGATPNQLAVPAIKWAAESLKAERFFLIGTDGLRAHATNAIIEDTIEALKGEVVGTQYTVVGESNFAPSVKKILHARPDVIINTLVGDSILSFFRALVDADITARSLPVLSFTLGENELAQLADPILAGNYVARARFQPLPTATADTFEQRFKKKYGEHRPVSESMEAAYYGVLLWAAAVERAGSEDVNRVRLALKAKEFELGNIRLRVDASNFHTWKIFQVGKVTNDNRIEVIKTDDAPIPPLPFPGPRTRAEWQGFADELYKKWGGNWANPQKPKIKKSRGH